MNDQAKYLHPKILLVDLKTEAEIMLKDAGYSVASGSFGVPYKVPRDAGHSPVIPNGNLPDFAEQEVVAVNLVPGESLEEPVGDRVKPRGEIDWWARNSRGVIDPRPRLMSYVQKDADRILSHGGTFVIFADGRDRQDLVWGYETGSGIIQKDAISCNNWSFLSILSRLVVENDMGQEIFVETDRGTPLGQLLTEHAKGAHFTCTVRPLTPFQHCWTPLAKNKYESVIAGIIAPEGPDAGRVFIFPQLSDKPRFLIEFLNNVLPDFTPHLFPHAEGANWVHQPQYEIPEVLALQQEIKKSRKILNRR